MFKLFRRKSKLPFAFKVKDLSRKKWHPGSSLYRLDGHGIGFNAGGFHVGSNFVIIAVSPNAVDTNLPETTAFPANKDGSLFGGFMDRDSPNPTDHFYVERCDLEHDAITSSRIYGKYDHIGCLLKLGFQVHDELAKELKLQTEATSKCFKTIHKVRQKPVFDENLVNPYSVDDIRHQHWKDAHNAYLKCILGQNTGGDLSFADLFL